MLKRALFPLLSLALVAQTTAPTAKKESPAPKKAVAAPAEDPILAQIGKKAVRQSDFDAFLELAVPAQQRSLVNASPEMKNQYLQRFLDFNILAAKAKQEKLDADPKFKKKLALREQETLVQELMLRDGEALQKQAKPTDEILKAYFEGHKDKFKTPDKYSVRHILIGSKENPGAEGKGLSDEEAKAKALKVLAELKGGKKIEDLAKEYSDDPGSKDKGGLYENISYGQFVPAFEETVKKQTPGEISEPVKTQFGYHLIQVEKKMPGEAPEFEKVKEKVKQAWLPQRQEEIFRAYIDQAKKGLEVTIKTPAAKPAKTKGTGK
ncbi:MAG: PpiC-type peptidyl-prolyl cis-trans isomerase [Holophagaceae bacterium]|nr:PpiC-type peptidyl-prolyl cis-trans isomerase [Holophagaceae bacterium]